MLSIAKLTEHPNFQRIMLLCCLVYALFFVLFEPISDIFRNILVLGTLLAFCCEGKKILKDPMVVMIGLAIVVQLISWANSLWVIPDFTSNYPKLDRLSKIFSFIFIAYWLKGSIKNVYLLWACYILGFFLACFASPDFYQQLSTAIYNSARVGFDIKNAQFTSMFSGISLLFSLFGLYQCLRNPFLSRSKKVVLSSLIIASVIICSFIVLVSQSRQVWLALAIVFFCLPIFYSILITKKLKHVIIGYAIFIAFGYLVSQSTFVDNRVSRESNTINAILQGDSIPMSSIGIRVNSWIEAWGWIKKNAIVGSGPNAIPLVIKQSDIFPIRLKHEFGHLHNYYIETLVAYGLLGLILVSALYSWSLRSLFIYRNATYKNNPKQRLEFNQIICCFLCLVLFWIIINNFETFSGRSFGVFSSNILFASIYTFYLTYSLTRKNQNQ